MGGEVHLLLLVCKIESKGRRKAIPCSTAWFSCVSYTLFLVTLAGITETIYVYHSGANLWFLDGRSVGSQNKCTAPFHRS